MTSKPGIKNFIGLKSTEKILANNNDRGFNYNNGKSEEKAYTFDN